MALMNFSLPFSGTVTPNWITTVNPIENHVTAVNNLLYSPEGHQAVDNSPLNQQQQQQQFYRNDPYAAPTQSPDYQSEQYHYRSRNHYLPPLLSTLNQKNQNQQLSPVQQRTISNYQSHQQTQTQYDESRYETHDYFNANIQFNSSNVNSETIPYDLPDLPDSQLPNDNRAKNTNAFPVNPPQYTQVQAGHGSNTQVHAVLDYDNDEYYDQENVGSKDPSMSTTTPIQGPIFVKNDSIPVVPLFSYPAMNNGSFVQIPIWWTALSVALGLEVRGEVIKGLPCVKRHNQLFCPTAGNSYPTARIEEFIDDNKALMRRMYGDFRTTNRSMKRKRETDEFNGIPGVPDITAPYDDILNLYSEHDHIGDSYFGERRNKRQSSSNNNNNNNNNNNKNKSPSRPNIGLNPSTEPTSGRIDACESKIEIVTPYWASNSAGKIRAIVNTQHFEQAIHQEVCTKMQTNRCGGDCGCEQKYKWHRLLAYDPDNDCKGIFMDWFLFPSCCVCRCAPI